MTKQEILYGDAYKLIKEIPNKSVDLIYTDVPYLYKNGGGGNSEISKRIIAKNQSIKDISNGIDYSILDEFKRVLKKLNLFIWCSKMQIIDILNYFADYNFEILVWCKTNPQPSTNNVWLPDVEYCLYFREKGVRLNDGYDLKSKWYLGAINQRDKKLYNHPTIKPLDLVERHIKETTQVGGVVLDAFLGSGTTAVACKELERNFIGFEINKAYYEIAVDRLKGVNQIEKQAKIEQLKLFLELKNET